jgi:hypothetical protein
MKSWTFCRRCFWQDEAPADSDGTFGAVASRVSHLTVCPACAGNLATMIFQRKDWMKHGADLLSGARWVADFDPRHPPRKPRNKEKK